MGLDPGGPIDIPGGVTAIAFELQRCTTATPTVWPNESTEIDVSIWITVDGVETFVCGFGARGGIVSKIDGAELTHTHASVSVPSGSVRTMRVEATIAGGPLRTTVSVTTDPVMTGSQLHAALLAG